VKGLITAVNLRVEARGITVTAGVTSPVIIGEGVQRLGSSSQLLSVSRICNNKAITSDVCCD